MTGPTNDRIPSRVIIEWLEELNAETFLGSDQAHVDAAVERLRELNALAAQAYLGLPPDRYCKACHIERGSGNRLHRRYVDLLVRAAKLERKLVLRAARLGRERARHAEQVRALEAAKLEADLNLAAGIRLASQMMNTPGQGLVGALLYRTLGGRTNVEQ